MGKTVRKIADPLDLFSDPEPAAQQTTDKLEAQNARDRAAAEADRRASETAVAAKRRARLGRSSGRRLLAYADFQGVQGQGNSRPVGRVGVAGQGV